MTRVVPTTAQERDRKQADYRCCPAPSGLRVGPDLLRADGGTEGSNPPPSSEESSANQVPSARPPWYTIAPAISSSLLGAGHRRCVCPYHPRRRFRFAYRPGYFDRLFEPHRQETFTFHRQELTVRGAQGAAKELVELSVPAKYRWVPDGLPGDSRYNVAQLYARLAESIRDGKPASPSFATAVTRHHLLDAIMRASETGRKQVL